MGGAASITMLLGMVKTKFAAVLIGTGGVGLLASFTVIQGLINTIAGLGIISSGVRDVAAAVAKKDQLAIGRTVLSLRRICWLTGLLGMSTVMLLSPLIGQLTFASDAHNLEIGALGLIILFANISGGQMALIQGSRRIGDIARVNITSALIATLITIGFYFWLGVAGIVPALVLSSAIQLTVSWYFARLVPVLPVELTWRESFHEAGSMVKLGIAIMWTGLVASMVTYATIVMISNLLDLNSVGLYSAAFALSGVFVNFVLQAMGADYYPCLTGVAHDKAVMNKLVNEQTEIGLLLAVPGILAMLVLAPWVLRLFYTAEFLPAVELLQWFTMGCLGRVISWPMGYIMLAMGKSKLLVISETMIQLLHLLLILLALYYFGLEGVGIAFLFISIVHIGVTYAIAKHLVRFRWDRSVLRMMLNISALFVFVFFLVQHLTLMTATIIGLCVLGFTTLICLRTLISRIGKENRLARGLYKMPGMRFLIGYNS
jgi:PST family polysaccharide transporter